MVNTHGKLNPNTIREKKNKIAGILLSTVGDTWEEQFDKLFSNEYLAFGVYKKNIKEFIALVQSTERTQHEELIEQVTDLLECPYILDEASIPKAGIENAPDYQVVGSMSVSLTRLNNLRSSLKLLSINDNAEDKSEEVRASSEVNPRESKEDNDN